MAIIERFSTEVMLLDAPPETVEEYERVMVAGKLVSIDSAVNLFGDGKN